jgi:hypothetical protein
VLALAQNKYGYQAGHRFNSGASLRRGLGEAWTVALDIDVAHEEAERWAGALAKEGNLGRTGLMAGLGATWQTAAGLWRTTVRVPLWTRFGTGAAGPEDEYMQVQWPALAEIGWRGGR